MIRCHVGSSFHSHISVGLDGRPWRVEADRNLHSGDRAVQMVRFVFWPQMPLEIWSFCRVTGILRRRRRRLSTSLFAAKHSTMKKHTCAVCLRTFRKYSELAYIWVHQHKINLRVIINITNNAASLILCYRLVCMRILIVNHFPVKQRQRPPFM